MTLVRHELRLGRASLAVWTAAIAFLMAVCVLLFPEMKGEMDGVGDLFASMGSFTEAFGMDKVNFGSLAGFYAVECGNILGLGGAFFSALLAASALSKEEKDHTADFLLTHPVSRRRVVTGKLAAVLAQIVLLNLAVFLLSAASIAAIGEALPWKELLLLHSAYLLLQIDMAGICFGISAFLRRGGMSVGLGLAAILYFLNLLANISDQAGFLKYLTPFASAGGPDIVSTGRLDAPLILLGLLYGAAGIGAAYLRYCSKDIS